MVLSVSPQPPVYMLVLLIRTIESSVILETVEWGGWNNEENSGNRVKSQIYNGKVGREQVKRSKERLCTKE